MHMRRASLSADRVVVCDRVRLLHKKTHSRINQHVRQEDDDDGIVDGNLRSVFCFVIAEQMNRIFVMNVVL